MGGSVSTPFHPTNLSRETAKRRSSSSPASLYCIYIQKPRINTYQEIRLFDSGCQNYFYVVSLVSFSPSTGLQPSSLPWFCDAFISIEATCTLWIPTIYYPQPGAKICTIWISTWTWRKAKHTAHTHTHAPNTSHDVFSNPNWVLDSDKAIWIHSSGRLTQKPLGFA